MNNTSIRTGRKPALWLRMGSVAAFTALTLTVSACTYEEPEKGAQPAPVNTEAIGKDGETATPSPSATPGTGASESPSTSPSALPTIPADLVDASALPASVSKEEIEEMRNVAKGFVTAHYGVNWTDAKPNTWLTRTVDYTTPQFQRELEASYADGTSTMKWDQIKKNQTKRFAEISSANIGVGKDYANGNVSVKVDFLVSVTSSQIDGTEVLNENHKFVNLVKTDGKWKVASIYNVAGGGA